MPKAITGENGGAPAANTNNTAAAARAKVFNVLHQEMALADYATGKSGQKVRRVPRSQLPQREAKRKEMRDADMMEMAIEADDDYEEEGDGVAAAAAAAGGVVKKKRKRLRGSKVAFDDVVLNSMPLGYNGKRRESKKKTPEINEERENGDIAVDQNERYEMLQEVAALGIDLDPDEVGKIDEFEEVVEEYELDLDATEYDEKDASGSSEHDESGDEEDEKGTEPKSQTVPKNESVSESGLVKPKKNKRTMHRLKEFTSQRLAEKHGEAIGAHIMGMSETAVQKLREVAKAAPGAPQVYSSLGMVFESMLSEIEGGSGDQKAGEISPMKLLQRRLELAQKAYASYHVAALLCKRDFVLWERSGDASIKTAHIYSEIIEHMANHKITDKDVIEAAFSTEDTTTHKGFDPFAGPAKWRSDRKVWMEHALSAYQSSDTLRPPGFDIPCKLAQVHISLRNYIEALSILTDLRNKANEKSSGGDKVIERSEMEGSYPCWLLYADLMMKIGYECKQWTDGNSKHQNYMFKRWLRKNSKDFDWKERRLQALCLALEAAAGSASCIKLVKWMRERADAYLDKEEKENNGIEKDAGDNAADNDAEAGAKENNSANENEAVLTKSMYEEGREKLLNMNRVELQKFDRMTKEMNLVAGSHGFKNRIAVRAALIEKYRAAMKELAMSKFVEEQQNDATNLEATASEQPDLLEIDLSPKPLPLQGSCATVYDIAVLLLRQCVQLKLFDGGLLAVQSVLDYSNKRASRHEKKVEVQRQNEMLQNAGQGLVQTGFKYDQINFESDDSDEEGLGTYISDDDDLEQPEILQSLKSGMLPVDIRAMHAVCLLGVGGQDYVALNYVEQGILSDELDLFGNDDTNGDVSNAGDRRWMSFSNYYNAPINKSSLLSSIADLVTENAKDHSRSHRVLRIFRKHLSGIDSNHGRNQGLDEALTNLKAVDRVHTLKILLASLKLMIGCARMDLTVLGDGKGEDNIVEKAVTDSIYTLMMMLRFQHILWNPRHSDWSLPESSLDMVSILSQAVSVLVQAASSSEDQSLLDSIQVGSMKARHLVSTICHADSAPSKPLTYSNVGTWRSFPLPASWQNSFHEKISLRAYNLCVACCVSSFSGWEPSEFNLDQLRTTDVNFFGVTLEGPCVAGFLPKHVASAVAEQWEYMQGILPDLEVLPFRLHLDERKKMDWYGKVMRNLEKQSIDSKKVSSYGEEDGVSALLSFSTLCLIAAEESEDDVKDEFVKLAMSVLLPLTQFSIDRQVWQSAIGTAVISCRNESKVGYYLDENSQWLGPTKTQEGRMIYTNKTQRSSKPAKVVRPNRKRPQPTNVIPVPTSVLMEEWTTDDDIFVEGSAASENAQLSMKKVEDAMKNLRKSSTLNALERASIDVAVSLIAVATYDECNNPFLCLQQAAMFAAMGSKRGNNDEAFKRFLPLKTTCTPLEALNILGRADCLRAIHFLHEAQYLCTWVASVCQSHRDRLQEDLPWNSRWRVIGIIIYMVSATIDETGESLSQNDSDAGALRKWEEVTKEEISRGESDALVLVRMNPAYISGPSQETNSNAPDDEENLLVEDQGSENEGAFLPLPPLGDEGIIDGMNHQSGDHNELNDLIAEQPPLPFLGEHGVINGMNHQSGHQNELNGSNAEQQFFEHPLMVPEIAGVENMEEGDDYDPFAGVEVVGI